MNVLEYLFTVLGEEASEIAQVCSKVNRFGLDDVYEGATNLDRLSGELSDLFGVIELLAANGVVLRIDRDRVNAKKEKVLKFMEYSRNRGCLETVNTTVPTNHTGKPMTTETMTVTRALAELKSIKARFQGTVNEAPMLALALGQGDRRKAVGASLSPDQLAEFIRSKFQSVEDLLKRHRAIKEALVASNAAVQVRIGNETMTVAAAIERKASMDMDRLLLNRMMQFMNQATNELNSASARLTADIDKGLASLFGSDRTKITEEQVKVVSDQKRLDFEPSLIDPIDLSAKIDEYRNRIDTFMLEVNFVLSESNARTEVTITY